jgi:hypothetical protein
LGSAVAFTMTRKEHVFVLLAASAAVTVTVFVPVGNSVPDAGLVKNVVTPQLSVAVGAKFAAVGQLPKEFILIVAGQTICGGSVSLTVTVKLQEFVPVEFVAVQVTVDRPLGKLYGDDMVVEPILYVIAGTGNPVAVAAKVLLAPHNPRSVLAVIFTGQEIAAGWVIWIGMVIV